MGLFNSVMIPWRDPETGKVIDVEIQFKYGDVWQHIYKIGDTILWKGNDIGDPSKYSVVAYGVPYEDVDGLPEFFEVYIIGNKIVKVVPWGGKIYWGKDTYKVVDPDQL